MNSIVRFRCSCRSFENVEDLRLDRHVERIRLVAESGTPAGSPVRGLWRSLPLTARELVRIFQPASAPRPTRRAVRSNPILERLPSQQAMVARGFGTMSSTRIRGFRLE